MLYAEEAWLRDGFTRLAQGEARTRGGVYKAFGRLADQAIPLSWYGNTVSTADAVSAAADLAHDWGEASEKMGEEGTSAALSDRTNLVYGAPMRDDFSKIRREPGSCKAEDGDIRRCVEEFLSVLFAEEAVGTQPAASGKLS